MINSLDISEEAPVNTNVVTGLPFPFVYDFASDSYVNIETMERHSKRNRRDNELDKDPHDEIRACFMNYLIIKAKEKHDKEPPTKANAGTNNLDKKMIV